MDYETEMLDAHDNAHAMRFLNSRVKTIQPEGVMSGGVPTMTDAERAEQLKTVGTDAVKSIGRTIGNATTSLGQSAANIGSDLLQDTANQMIAPTLQTTEGEDIKLKAPIYNVPQVETANGFEALMSDIVQFGMGMAIAPGSIGVKAAASAFAFDPVEADLAGALNEMGVLPAALEFLTSTPEEMETAEGRMRQRMNNVLQEIAVFGSVDGIIRVVKNVKNTPEVMDRFTTAIGNKFVEAGQAADVRIAERAADTGVTLSSGVDPTDVVDRIISAQARYFETGNYEPPTKENPVSVVKPKENSSGIIAFHGSGANFDEFRLEMIGTGEGAQVYGHGLYFTDNEDIAKFYRDSIGRGRSSIDYDGDAVKNARQVDNLTDREMILDNIATEMAFFDQKPENVIAKKITNLKQKIDDPVDISASASNAEAQELIDLIRQSAQRELKIYESLDPSKFTRGKMYKVGLAPKPDELMDYDLSLNQQPEKIKKVLQPFYEKYGVANTADVGTLLESARRTGAIPDDALTEKFVEAGIPGIKYRAAGSRGANVDASDAEMNYVIFDDKAIKILEKYGIAAPVAVTATAASLQTDKAEANPILRKAVSSLAKNTTDVKVYALSPEITRTISRNTHRNPKKVARDLRQEGLLDVNDRGQSEAFYEEFERIKALKKERTDAKPRGDPLELNQQYREQKARKLKLQKSVNQSPMFEAWTKPNRERVLNSTYDSYTIDAEARLATVEAIAREAKKRGLEVYYTSKGERGRAGSRYIELPDGSKVRVSDHELPDTAQRQYTRSQGIGNFADEIIVSDWETSSVDDYLNRILN